VGQVREGGGGMCESHRLLAWHDGILQEPGDRCIERNVNGASGCGLFRASPPIISRNAPFYFSCSIIFFSFLWHVFPPPSFVSATKSLGRVSNHNLNGYKVLLDDIPVPAADLLLCPRASSFSRLPTLPWPPICALSLPNYFLFYELYSRLYC
jgi:hypothetical protein